MGLRLVERSDELDVEPEDIGEPGVWTCPLLFPIPGPNRRDDVGGLRGEGESIRGEGDDKDLGDKAKVSAAIVHGASQAGQRPSAAELSSHYIDSISIRME